VESELIMTPLAQRFARETTLPLKDRKLRVYDGLLSFIHDVHCFEVSPVMPAIKSMARAFGGVAAPDSLLAFLPAPRTWLEFVDDGGERGAYLLTDTGNGYADVWCISEELAIRSGNIALRPVLEARANGAPMPVTSRDSGVPQDMWFVQCYTIWAALAVVNSPHIVRQKSRPPHAGLQRRLAQAKGLVGKFPLRAWTEIKLDISPNGDGESAPVETRLTGERAYHFVRSYVKPSQGGKLVASHWKGNPALGIVRSRYCVVGLSDSTPPAHPHH
jgi:hypothetical protein